MGFMSRRVLPVCGSFCVCCPALRSRSRQPVKRYKKLIADILPKNQNELPNERKIVKLCDYASKNPLRIPKIATSLEQKGYRELRSERFGSVRVIMSTFMKLFSSCKGQMPLFAASSINMIKILLDQTRHDDMCILGCHALFEFVQNQIDGTYIQHVDAMLPSLLRLAEETNEEVRQRQLRSAGLRALSSIIWFMGVHPHMPSEYGHEVFYQARIAGCSRRDEDGQCKKSRTLELGFVCKSCRAVVVSVIMNNYEYPFVTSEGGVGDDCQYWVNEVVKAEGRGSMFTVMNAFRRVPSQKEPFTGIELTSLNSGIDIPSVWAKICVEKIAQLAKEVTTTRRFLEPMFNFFDLGKHWSFESGLAISVLQQMLFYIEKSGNGCFLMAVLVRHLDHKNVSDKPQVKAGIIKIVASLAQMSRSEATVVEIGVLSDLLRHLRQSLQADFGDASDDAKRANDIDFKSAIQECLLELIKKVGDTNPIFEMMAVTLEKISAVPALARSTAHALLTLARILASVAGHLQMQQSFPEALLHQLSLVMVHPDSNTRISAHHIFETVLIPIPHDLISCTSDAGPDILKRNLVMSAIASHSAVELLKSLRKDTRFNVPMGDPGLGKRKQHSNNTKGVLFKGIEPKLDRTTTLEAKDQEMDSARLSGDQAALLLSAVWNAAIMSSNFPANYESIFMTFSLTLIFSSAQNSSHNIFVRSLQLALSLKTVALMDTHSSIPPSRRRSLFVLSSAMLIIASKIYNITGIISYFKSLFARGLVDPFLELADDIRLRTSTKMDTKQYGTPIDNMSAQEILAKLSLEKELANESLVSIILSNSSCSFEMELSSLHEELLRMFSAEDGFALGSDLQINPNRPWAAVLLQNTISFNEVVDSKEDLMSDISCTDLPQFFSKTPIHTPSVNVIGVSQLLESALETAGQVAVVSAVSATPLSYSAVATRCEEFGTTARKNMSIWTTTATSNKLYSITNPEQIHSEMLWRSTKEAWQSLQLPPITHYDNFLRAAGC